MSWDGKVLKKLKPKTPLILMYYYKVAKLHRLILESITKRLLKLTHFSPFLCCFDTKKNSVVLDWILLLTKNGNFYITLQAGVRRSASCTLCFVPQSENFIGSITSPRQWVSCSAGSEPGRESLTSLHRLRQQVKEQRSSHRSELSPFVKIKSLFLFQSSHGFQMKSSQKSCDMTIK